MIERKTVRQMRFGALVFAALAAWPAGVTAAGLQLKQERSNPPSWVEGGREVWAREGRSEIYPPPIYSQWYYYYWDWAYVGPDCGEGLWAPQVYFPNQCGEYGGCDCWSTFATWYYQDNLMCWNASGPVEVAPLTFGDFGVAIDWAAPPAPTYEARFEPIDGFECLKNIPLECTNSARPVAAAARYAISLGGSTSSPSDFAGALFFVTAVYDETLFDVKVAGAVLTHPGSYYEWAYRKDPLRSLGSIMFQNLVFSWNPPDVTFRQSEWRTVPDYVEVGLKDGRTLDDVKGRTVRLFLHTLRWAGDSYGCPIPRDGDRVDFARTDTLDVGVCSDTSTDDWWIEPPPLDDECAAPSLPEARQRAAEFEAVGVRVVNDLNVELPSMRVGHNRWKAGRSLAETLGNDAKWYAFGSAYSDTFLAVNMFGVWFAVEDVPGWNWSFYQEGSQTRLRVNDTCADKSYRFLTTDSTQTPGQITYEDYMFRGAKLINVHQPAGSGTSQRTYDYQGGSVAGNLIRQKETAAPSLKIDYGYTTQGSQLLLTVTGTSPDGTRQAETRFDPPANPLDPGTRPLVQASITGGGPSRLYEWYPDDGNPATKYDRKLKKVSDLAGNVLAEFTYDYQGRLIKKTRGSTAMGNHQILAEFLYGSSLDADSNGTMEARFYVDETDYQVAVRTFDKHNQVIKLAEYGELSSTNGVPAITVFDYHIPPENTQPGEADPFYHQVCTIGGQQVVQTRCMQKTWPAGDLSEYTLFNCDFNVVEAFMAPPGITGMPAGPQSHMTRTWARNNPSGPDWGIWQITQECDVSRNGCTDLTYDSGGFLTRRDDPMVTTGVYTGFRAFRTRTYDSKHRVDYETRNDGTGATVTINYGYDTYDNLNRRTEKPGADQIEWLFTHDAFGQEVQRTDPDGYVTRQEWNSAGMLTRTYAYAAGASGPVLRQTDYVYTDGRLTEVRVADNDGPFTLNAPAGWVVTTYAYDAYGRVVSRTVTPGNHVTTYEYDAQDRITRITYPDGLWKQTIRNGRGQIVETRIGPDPVLVSTYAYDPNGNLVHRSCQGCPDCATETTYQYDAYNRRTAEIRPDGTTHFEYDNAGQVTRQYVVDTQTVATLAETRTEYDNLGRPWRMRELAAPGGSPNNSADRITEVGFDRAGNTTLRRQKAAAGDGETVFTYDFANRQTSVTDAEGGVTTYGHDGRGNVVFISDPVGNEIRFAFDASGRPVEEKRYEGATLDLRVVSAYDSRDNRIRETAYDAGGTPLTQKRREYDELGRTTRRVQMADPANVGPVSLAVDRVTDLTYVAGSERVDTETTYAGDPPQPRTTDYDYDAVGRLTLITDPEGNTESRTYTVHSQVLTKTVTEPPLGARSYTYAYDDLGRVTSEVANGPPALTTTHQYDALGRSVRTVDAEGIATQYAYNAFGDPIWVTENADAPAPRQTESQFNQLGHLTLQRTWDGLGLTETTTYQNDKLGRRTRIDFCDGGAWVYVYDDAGRMTQRTDPRGQVSVYTHNRQGQVLTKTVDALLEETFTYTPLGWMTLAERDASHRVTFSHDGFGQVTTETQSVAGVSKTVTYDHNQAGDRTLLGYPADVGVTLTFDHDALGQTTAVHRNGQLLADYAYAGRFPTDRAARTASTTETWIRRHVDYDVHRRQTAIVNRADVAGTLTELDRYDYTYDNVGNRETAEVAGDPTIADSILYGYDGFHRLTSAAYAADESGELFDYDLLGNRLTYTDRAGADTTYDHNCVNEYTAITPGGQAPQHDAAGNLVRTEHGYELAYDYENRLIAVRDPTSAVLATFAYDALGRRVQQVRDGRTTRFCYDGQRVLAEYDGAGALLRYSVDGPTYVDEHLLIHEHGRDFFYLLAALHSVTGLADETGQIVQRYTYDAYGLPTVFDGGGAGLPPVGDADGDGDVDLADLAAFQVCYGGPGVPYGLGCDVFDTEPDGDVDARDLRVLLALLDGRGDFDGDLDIDAEDGALLAGCLAGPGVPPPGGCEPGDLDGDGDVDLADAGVLQRVFTGPRGGSAGPANPYYFTGRRLDFDIRDTAGAVTGRPGRPLLALYDYRARAYDPWHGRFTSRDPAEYAESLNLYQYVLSNPQGFTDPTGQFSFGSMLSAIGTGARIYGMYETGMTIRRAIADFAQGVSFHSVMLDLLIGLAVDRVGGKALDLLVDVAGPVLRKVGRKVVASVRGGRAPVDVGKAGEIAAGIPSGPKTRIPSLSGKAQFRIPDELSEGEFLKEVKNVADRLGYTGQIEDFFLYAQKMDIEFILVTKKTTKLVGDLKDLVDSKMIKWLPILD